MGIRVSALAPDSDEEDRDKGPDDSIHGYAIGGDLERLKALVADGADVNARDEYVSNQQLHAPRNTHESILLGSDSPASCC